MYQPREPLPLFDHAAAVAEKQSGRGLSAPTPLPDDVALLTIALRNRRWVIKTELMTMLRWDERRIQEAKQASRGAVISSSQRGYCLMIEASQEEADAAIGEFTKRLKTMGATLTGMIRARHAKTAKEAA